MKEYTTAEIFEELWKRMEYDANVSEELATESNELQERINKAIEYIRKNTNIYKCEDETICMFDEINASPKELLDILKGSDKDV